ncbi:MAG: hypothetical protein OEY95_03620 [Candidatus Bathyarchaeota archaeon]|nr:hypothetical protein [Candidatus Bathyarchaeota archaeon]
MPAELLAKYKKTVEENEGKWFALKPDGELLAVAKDEKRLWKKIHKQLDRKVIEAIDLIIGYSQTKKERETMCLLPLISTKEV